MSISPVPSIGLAIGAKHAIGLAGLLMRELPAKVTPSRRYFSRRRVDSRWAPRRIFAISCRFPNGVAAGCYPMKDGKVYVPSSPDPIWNTYATAVEAQGLVAGYRWTKWQDSPHCEAR